MNGQSVLEPVEALSSPRHIIAIKRSSVSLHWNYTYAGDGRSGPFLTFAYGEQTIGFNSTSRPTLQTLARRIGQNGALALESPVPAPFNGRLGMISSNSTLVVHNVQFNDSNYQFSSNVIVNSVSGSTRSVYDFNLKPVVSITVNGMSVFIFFKCLCCSFDTYVAPLMTTQGCMAYRKIVPNTSSISMTRFTTRYSKNTIDLVM